MATARSPVKVPCENEDLPEKENAPEFDEDTLRATADVYRNEGNEAFKKGGFISAFHFYSKGIKMNCNEKELKAKLYNNRAIAHFKLGNHQNSLRDAEAAVELNPTFLKAIVRGATACVELKRFKEGITWCDKGLAVTLSHTPVQRLGKQALVVLSCCYSGRGEIKAEGVVGIARAFMGAGARSVVVSLWAVEDKVTLEFMKCFYQHLAEGKPASESLNLAMKNLRESDEFRDIKYWAPFLLIGDDVSLDFMP